MISVITPALVKDTLGHQWLHEAIASVAGQPGDWEHIVVNDHSPVSLDALKEKWPHVRWLDAEGQGVSMARNQAAEAAWGDLLLPLDADDKLAPGAIDSFLDAWEKRGDAGIVYSDVVMFGEDYAKVYLAAEYSFRTLLKATFMTVGCLHRKDDWERVGGWRLDMQQGLEDWEYWIAMGELGVCGKRVAEPLYWYRRHPRGRLQWLKANHDLWDRAYNAMRELHKDSYDGRFPMGCCGGRAPAGATRPLHGGVPRAQVPKPSAVIRATVAQLRDNSVLLVYSGARKGDFLITGGVSRTKYRVPGQGGIVELATNRVQGINPSDLNWFLSVNQGRDFKIVPKPQETEPAPAPAPKPAPQQAPAPQPVNVKAWEPEIMEGGLTGKMDGSDGFIAASAPPEMIEKLRQAGATIPEPTELGDGQTYSFSEQGTNRILNIQEMTVAEIRELDIDPDQLDALAEQERRGKNRKTVLDILGA